MSAIVTDILAAMYSECSTALGATYQELAHVYYPEKNNVRQARLAYGVRPKGGEPAATTIKSFATDQVFDVVLTDTVPKSGDNDSQLRTAVATMFNKGDEIFKRIITTRLGVNSVLVVFGQRYLDPEVIPGDTLVASLVMQVTIKHRTQIT